ncbi:MAG: 2-oxoacid:acceptor oxidoreductase subunit alpha [Candidatus Verstraetearchaeota archaeon]|nr:2-oxoacid:acceptor oxidoreductase subunit alpha [Candidatus Verstraetearchaeota archaeon]
MSTHVQGTDDMDLNFIVGGPQGGGVETAGLLAVRALSMQGLEVFADREYHSNIKGKHSYSHIRASDRPVGSIKYPVDFLGALDAETMATHFHEVRKGGIVVHDAAIKKRVLTKIPSMDVRRAERLRESLKANGIGNSVGELDDWLERQGITVMAVPFGEIISERAGLSPPMIERAMNTALTSALLLSAGVPINTLVAAINVLFRDKREAAQLNAAVAKSVGEEFERIAVAREIRLPRIINTNYKKEGRKMLVAGNDAVAIGKLLGGLRLQTYYPITPAADESFTIEQHSELRNGLGETIGSPLVIQAEDEIAAICMAIGGALAGVRAATCTSGPGFSLMVEGIGWAGNNEVPVVVTYYQRGGPSTGLPTRHSQSDLLFSISSGHGEFARIVLASGSHFEALNDAIKCMNFAERYQLPVIHLLDKGIANCMTTIAPPFLNEIDRGDRFRGDGIYKRFLRGEAVSPRAYLGEEVMWYTGDEHDEIGHISEDPFVRREMYEKRMEKREKILSETKEEDKAVLIGEPDYKDLIITWGITTGAAADALTELNSFGHRVSVLQVRMMEPFPNELVESYLSEAEEVICAEANYLGQLAELIEWNCGIRLEKRVLKYTGRMITQDEIVSSFNRVKNGERRITLGGGE